MTDAAHEQRVAADPAASTWLSANAGSGKTRVLIDRVARLLLGGTRPDAILCLTYTKAAAAEMQNRLFDRLGRWAMLSDAALSVELADLGEDGGNAPDDLAQARRLFAAAIDTPGGLRIQTIHAFASALLRRFPIEAGVSPQFSELDDRGSRLLAARVLEDLAQSDEASVLHALAENGLSGAIDKLLVEIVAHRHAMTTGPDDDAIARMLDLSPKDNRQGLVSEVVCPGDADLLHELLEETRAAEVGDREIKAWERLDLSAPGSLSIEDLERAYLTKTGSRNSKVPHARPKQRMGEEKVARLLDFFDRLVEARKTRVARVFADQMRALRDFAAAFLSRYEAAKADQGLLDFDDLISRTRALLNDPGRAAWVLFKLDGNIAHVLVDEAQDTSPDQWDIIARLTDEYFAGEGTQAGRRTLFVVGDKKQSIYSFQGADTEVFDRKREAFTAKGMQEHVLQQSFRSSPNILRLVDLTFAGAPAEAIGEPPTHYAFRHQKPGRVELWPVISDPGKEPDADPTAPVDRIAATSAVVQLSERIADWIATHLRDRTPVPIHQGTGFVFRPITPGDILILVQRRSGLYPELIRACKRANLPMAGSDRLKLGAERAVKDLAALLAFLAMPEDDLSLATVLRSPIGGLSEAELYTLAQGRDGLPLWAVLRQAESRFPATLQLLRDLLDQADFLRPYDLMSRALIRHGARERLLGRLGPEAEDGIDELLSQALAYETREVPSLTGFLAALETDEVEVKRPLDSAGGAIRVMTVHGAKGLEAPVVILPDTALRLKPNRNLLIAWDSGVIGPVGTAGMRPSAVDGCVKARKARDAAEGERLLYVAMTRAQSWLVVAAAGKVDRSDKSAADGDDDTTMSWYRRIEGGMAQLVPGPPDADDVRRHQFGDWPEAIPAQAPGMAATPSDLTVHLDPPPPFAPKSAPLSPSDLGGAKALPGEDNAEGPLARARGKLFHLYLEHLPGLNAADQDRVARLLAASAAADPDADDEAGVGVPADAATADLALARRILAEPALAAVFGDASLAEVPFAVPFGQRMMVGAIDRLIVTDSHVMAIDIKTNRRVPETEAEIPEGILRQMGAYAHALAALFPGRDTRAAILWTETATLMPVSPDILRQALARATTA